MTDALLLHPDDNVEILTRDAGDIAQGHKRAMRAIARGDRVIKYGQTIGFAVTDIAPGDWVHTHNLEAGAFDRDSAAADNVPPDPQPIEGRTFMGYRRAQGPAGTRNYLAVISTVNCSASVSRAVARRFDHAALTDYPNIDGVFAVTHPSGCAIPTEGPDHQTLRNLINGIARHPNVGGALIIGLGCEVNLVQPYVQLGAHRDTRIETLNIQDLGGTVATVEAGVARVVDMLPRVNDVKREPMPASDLVVALECGGSDGNSGVTANPALGIAADMIVAAGGTAVLGETPEIYGAEHLLTSRAINQAVVRALLDRVQWWAHYAAMHHTVLGQNPSPGNKRGGLTTIYEKSLGAVAKGGSTALRAVFQYAEPIYQRGFVFMDTPGYDPASVTGMVAGGANVVCFTTGRGSCFGCKPAPSLKIASNTPMYDRMRDDMDVNAGVILEGTSVADVGRDIFETILRVAGGEPTRSEAHGLGDEEFVPWLVGPVL